MGDNLIITGTDIETVRRKTWKQEDNINIHQALSASSSLQEYGLLLRLTVNNIQMADPIQWKMQI